MSIFTRYLQDHVFWGLGWLPLANTCKLLFQGEASSLWCEDQAVSTY